MLILGIIRGIDPVQKVFYILAAVSQDALQEVNALFKGALTLPQPLLTQVRAARSRKNSLRESLATYEAAVVATAAIVM